MDFKTVPVFGLNYAVVDYQQASDIIIEEAKHNHSFGVFALPVHGVVEAKKSPKFYEATQKTNLIVPDGQPIRWAMNSFHKVNLKDRVYGPELTLHVLRKANELGLNVYLYGGATQEILDGFAQFIKKQFPKVNIVGKYREDKADGNTFDYNEVNQANAHILLIGRGCPRQEIWTSQHLGKVNAVMMAVGAAFSFHSGHLDQAPNWMQKAGLEWLFRFIKEPRRLWKRYLTTNSYFIYLFFKHKFILRKP